MRIYVFTKQHVRLSMGFLALLLICLSYLIIHNKEIVSVTGAPMEKPIFSVDTERPQVAISFDAEWKDSETDKILEALERNNVTSTFFISSVWIERFPDKVKAIHDAGHDIGNHTDTHPIMNRLGPEDIRREITRPHQLVKDLVGVDMELFRAPYGEYNKDVLDIAWECGYYTIQWNVDSQDWRDFGKDDMYNRVVNSNNLRNGAIILFHNFPKYTAESLDRIIQGIRDKGYDIVPISDLIMRTNYYVDQTGRQCRSDKSKDKFVDHKVNEEDKIEVSN